MKTDNSTKLWNKFKTKPASHAIPPKVVDDIPTTEYITNLQHTIWENFDKNLFYEFKKGIMLSQKRHGEDIDFDSLMILFYETVFDNIRNNIDRSDANTDQKQEQLLQINNISNVFKHLMLTLKSLKFKLDENSVIAIMNGYITGEVNKVIKK